MRRNEEKILLGSFLFRDDCYTLLTRLVNVSSSISRLNGAVPASAEGATISLRTTEVASTAEGDEHQHQHEDAPMEPSENGPDVAIDVALSPATNLSEGSEGNFETMVDETLPCTAAQVIRCLIYGSG